MRFTGGSFRRFAAMAAGLGMGLLGGCVLGPDYAPPKTEVPAAYSAAGERHLADRAAPSFDSNTDPSAVLAEWWKSFHDPELDHLVEIALSDNLDILGASARIIQARAQTEAANAGLFPSIAGQASANRYKVPSALQEQVQQGAAAAGGADGGAPGGAAGGAAGGSSFQIPKYLSVYRVGFDANWELDLWGGTVRTIQGAKAQTEAAYFSRRGAVVAALAEIGNEYSGLRATQARIAIAERTYAGEEQLLSLTQDRQKHGLASDLDTAQARANLETTRSQLPPLQAQALQHIHAIAILLGRTPESLEQELGTSAPTLVTPPEVPVGLPSALLANRPDIRAADRQLAAANAQVGVAIARRLPSITLTAGTGYASGALTDLIKSAAWTWNAGASLSAPILDFGRLEANERVAKAAALEQNYQYRKTVLQAFQDVEDSLQGYASARARRDALTAAVDAGSLSLQRSTDQFKAGLASYLTVLDADTRLANAQDQLAQSEQAQVQSLIAVYKALGGGWQAGEAGLPKQLKLSESLRVASGSAKR